MAEVRTTRAHPLGGGSIVHEALELLKRHPMLAAPLAILGVLSTRGGPFYAVSTDAPLILAPLVAGALVLTGVVAVALLLAQLLAILVVARAAYDSFGTRASLDFSTAWRHVRGIRLAGTGTLLAGGVAIGLGLLLFVVPGAMLVAGWLPLAVIMAVERVTGLRAFANAWRITRGHKGDLFLAVLAIVAAALLAGVVVAWLPIIGSILVSLIGGIATTVAVLAGVVFYVKRVAVPYVPVVAAPAVLDL